MTGIAVYITGGNTQTDMCQIDIRRKLYGLNVWRICKGTFGNHYKICIFCCSICICHQNLIVFWSCGIICLCVWLNGNAFYLLSFREVYFYPQLVCLTWNTVHIGHTIIAFFYRWISIICISGMPYPVVAALVKCPPCRSVIRICDWESLRIGTDIGRIVLIGCICIAIRQYRNLAVRSFHKYRYILCIVGICIYLKCCISGYDISVFSICPGTEHIAICRCSHQCNSACLSGKLLTDYRCGFCFSVILIRCRGISVICFFSTCCCDRHCTILYFVWKFIQTLPSCRCHLRICHLIQINFTCTYIIVIAISRVAYQTNMCRFHCRELYLWYCISHRNIIRHDACPCNRPVTCCRRTSLYICHQNRILRNTCRPQSFCTALICITVRTTSVCQLSNRIYLIISIRVSTKSCLNPDWIGRRRPVLTSASTATVIFMP